MGTAGDDAGHAGRDGPFSQAPNDQGVHRRRPRGAARAPARSAWSPAGGNVPLGYFKDEAKSARDVPRHRRRALLVPRRHGEGRRRRLADAARPRQPGDQHRRREGLPRGGRGSGQASRRHRRLPRGRGRRRPKFGQAVTAVASRADRNDDRRGGRDRGRRRRSSPATRRRSGSCSSAPCPAPRTARPTTRRRGGIAVEALGLT